ncbi:hypothetical protein KCU81_g9, partial [Aureobasidium melanogenum]
MIVLYGSLPRKAPHLCFPSLIPPGRDCHTDYSLIPNQFSRPGYRCGPWFLRDLRGLPRSQTNENKQSTLNSYQSRKGKGT